MLFLHPRPVTCLVDKFVTCLDLSHVDIVVHEYWLSWYYYLVFSWLAS